MATIKRIVTVVSLIGLLIAVIGVCTGLDWGKVLAGFFVFCGVLATAFGRRTQSGGNKVVDGGVAGTQADVDSSLDGLKRTTEAGVESADTSAGRLSEAKSAVDSGASAIDDALAEDRKRTNGDGH